MRRLALSAALAALLALPASASAASSQFTILEAPRELSSIHASVRADAFDDVERLGAGWIRVLVYWKSVAPNADSSKFPGHDERDPASYDLTQIDRVVREARARGLRVLLTPTGQVPKWASANRRSHTYRPSAVRFGRFVEALGRRYREDITHWSIWNEPNHPQFLTPQYRRGRPYSPRVYRSLWRAAVKGLQRSGNGRDRMLAGETAPRGTRRVVAPVDFVQGFFCRGCGDLSVDGWAHHPYTTKAGPWFRPRDRDDVTIGVLSRLTRALDRETRNGIPVYITEFGIQSEPDPYVGVSETRQAEYRAIAERIAHRNRRVRSFAQYMLRDDLPREGRPYVKYSGFESGLRHSDGAAKLAFDGFKLPMVALRVGRKRPRVLLWGLVRKAEGRTEVRIDYRNPGQRRWRYLKADRTNSRGVWRTSTSYRRGRSYRVRWEGEAGPRTRVYRNR